MDFKEILSNYDFVFTAIPSNYRIIFIVLAISIFFVFYAIFIYFFYKSLTKSDLFELNLKQYNKYKHYILAKLFGTLLYIAEYIIILPLAIFFWFVILAFFLAVISDNSALFVLIISASLVTAVRISAYIKKEISLDLAKLLPFTFLAIMIVNYKIFNLGNITIQIKEMINNINLVFYYLIGIVAVELIMRISIATINFFKEAKNPAVVAKKKKY